jgi:MoaA/NifB/PqqE/SkfB family radical SAM enzyme
MIEVPKNRMIVFVMHDACNYDCCYCSIPSHLKKMASELDRFRDGSYVNKFDMFGSGNDFVISGGEPLITPHIQDFFARVVQNKNKISVYTNLGVDVSWLATFSKNINYIMASLTPAVDYSPELEKFVDKVKFLRKNKINAVVRFVATKPRIPLIGPLAKMLKKSKIPLIVYPEFKYQQGLEIENYTQDEAVEIYTHANCIGKINLQHVGVRGAGLKCTAGNRSLYVSQNGNIYPCVNFTDYGCIGNVYDGTLAPVENISCGSCCTCDIQYFYGINGVRTHITDTNRENYESWIRKNKLDNKWWVV